MAESQLQHRLERLGRRVLDEVEAWEERTRTERAKALETITKQVGAAIANVQKTQAEQRVNRRVEKAQRRAEKRAQEREDASTARGLVQLAIAAVCIAFALLRPDLWWLIFVAMGVGIGGGRQLGLAADRRRLARGEPRRDEEPPEKQVEAPHEVDALCDQLLADLKASPEAVRSFLQQPEKTVESLRATCKALDARRVQLAAEDAKSRLAGLDPQRSALIARRDASVDAEARGKLDDAVRSLDGQAGALSQLALVTERVEGEYTSLLVLLQELETRVAVAKSTGSDVQLAGLRESVGRLNTELGAISEAMEAVQRQDLSPVVEVEPDPGAARAASKERV